MKGFLPAALLTLAFPIFLQAQEYPEMVAIPPGTFIMGGDGDGFNHDEAPRHEVTITRAFRISATEVTNIQYEQFRPAHKALRGKGGFSTGDDEAVVFVSWYDACSYCKWLSKKTGKHYRLPTEAEWEYACRAGTATAYNTGDTLPESASKHQNTERNLVPVSLETAQGEPNAFGLYDMHGNVEEWCLDLYGPYGPKAVKDPAGPKEGSFRVTRGGSHNTPVEYLRSSNRSAAIAGDSHSQIGFRVVESDFTPKPHRARQEKPLNSRNISRKLYRWPKASAEPFWLEPVPFVIPPSDETPFYKHNHQPAVTWCRNGDLLAIWFSCDNEHGREMVVLGSRLRAGTSRWDPASLFFSVPDRNMTGSSLLTLPEGEILHMNGVANSGDWQNLALVTRFSNDGNGATWSPPVITGPEHARRHQVIAGPIVLSDGTLIQCCDAGAGGQDGTAIFRSEDSGLTWEDTGATIPGIHAGIAQLDDGSLIAFGRGNSIDGRMPVSRSTDGGRTWESEASIFPPIGSGQRLVLKKLQEGPLMLVSFGENGMFATLSSDGGRTWSDRVLMTDGKARTLDGGAWTGPFTMDSTHAEPKGYLCCTQTPDGTIHLLSSRLHYRFNLAWLLSRIKAQR